MYVYPFDLEKIMNSGQCFNYIRIKENNYVVMSNGMVCEALWDRAKNELILNTDNEEYWKRFFAIEVDYGNISEYLMNYARKNNDSFAQEAISNSKDIRILKQELFEICCTFIISQQNNLKRIQKIVYAISQKYSKPIRFKLLNHEVIKIYPFPSYKNIKKATLEELKGLGLGYRAQYIFDFLKVWPNIEKLLKNSSSYDEAFETLVSCNGIGKKVANCILLFGLGYLNAFPIDVWMKKVIDEHYNGNEKSLKLPELYAGVLQQYMFDYKRNS